MYLQTTYFRKVVLNIKKKNVKTITINQMRNFDYAVSDEDLKKAEELSKWFSISSSSISSRFNKVLQENKQLKEQIKEIEEYINDFIKHGSYGNDNVDESIKKEFHNIMLIIKYAKAKGSDK